MSGVLELARTGGVASQAARNLRGTSPAFKGLSTATLYPGLFTAEAQRTQCELMNLMPVELNRFAVELSPEAQRGRESRAPFIFLENGLPTIARVGRSRLVPKGGCS
jgi:hypothetical protein